jgi:putative peptidoglycan lipid II flippase
MQESNVFVEITIDAQGLTRRRLDSGWRILDSAAVSENLRMARAAGLISVLTLLSRITGLVRDAVIGYFFGTGTAADAFFVAFRLPNLLRRFAAEGAMSVAFVPIFSSYLETERRDEAVRALQSLLAAVLALLAIIVVLGMVGARLWVAVFAPGFVEDPVLTALTVQLTRLLFPYALLISLVALLGSFLHAGKRFLSPALSPVALNVAIIAAAVWLSRHVEPPIAAVAWGVLIGGVLQVSLQAAPLAAEGIRLMPRWDPHHPAVRRALFLIAPAVFGAAIYQLNVLIGTVMASILPAGSVSYLWYADRVFEFPLGLLAVALGTAALPTFAGQVARGAMDEMRYSVSISLAIANFLAVPATAGLICLATPITSVLFQRGAFGANEVEQTALALQCFAVGLWAVSVARILAPAFYALGDSRTPVRSATLALFANVAFGLMLIGRPEAEAASLAGTVAALARTLSIADLRHGGIALATSLAAVLNAVQLGILLRRRIGGLRSDLVVGSLGRSTLATLPMIPVLLFTARGTDWLAAGNLLGKAAALGVSIGAGCLVFAAAAWWIGGPEVERMRTLIRRRTAEGGSAS